MTDYPKSGPGRCEQHDAVLYQDEDGYRCWPCEDVRIRARQAQLVDRSTAPREADLDRWHREPMELWQAEGIAAALRDRPRFSADIALGVLLDEVRRLRVKLARVGWAVGTLDSEADKRRFRAALEDEP
jgi:hypothetical protein